MPSSVEEDIESLISAIQNDWITDGGFASQDQLAPATANEIGE